MPDRQAALQLCQDASITNLVAERGGMMVERVRMEIGRSRLSYRRVEYRELVNLTGPGLGKESLGFQGRMARFDWRCRASGPRRA
jgi:hypothetical protein